MYEIQSGRAIEVNVKATAVMGALAIATGAQVENKRTHLLERPKGLCHIPFVASCLLQDENDRVDYSRGYESRDSKPVVERSSKPVVERSSKPKNKPEREVLEHHKDDKHNRVQDVGE